MSEICVWKEAAPQTSTNRDFPNLRSFFVNLDSMSICPSDSIVYAFVFVSSATKKILGQSNLFGITDNPIFDSEVKDITSILEVLVDVGHIPGLDSGSLQHLKSFMEPVQHRSEPDCVVSFKRRAHSTTASEGDRQQQQQRLLRPAGRMGGREDAAGAAAAEEEEEDE